MQTLKGVFYDDAKFADTRQVLVTPMVREQLYGSCDIGRPASHLTTDFPELGKHFVLLGEDPWWLHQGVDHVPVEQMRELGGVPEHMREPLPHVRERLDHFRKILLERPEQRILIVCHGVVIHQLTGAWVQNCQTQEWDITVPVGNCVCEGLACDCPAAPHNAVVVVDEPAADQ